MHNPTSIRALFSLPGFVAASRLHGVFGDRYARVLVLRRRKKQRSARDVDTGVAGATTHAPVVPATSRLAGWRIYVQFERCRVHCPRCRSVFVERLDWLAKNPRYTQRFAMHVGALCREMTNKAVAEVERLHDSTVKDLDKIYMQQQVARAGLPAPRAIGVDEIAIRKGHDYRIVVSDLDRGRPIWVGGKGRTEADMDLFFATLGAKKTARIQLAAMDMWKPFRTSLRRHAPQARVVFDKFHIMRHLGDALDAVRRSEYRRLAGKDRAFIKGQRYTLLSHRENLSLDGRRSLPSCSRPTSGSTPPTCSKSPSASSGTTRPRAGPAPSSRGGNRASSGSGSRPTRSSRR